MHSHPGNTGPEIRPGETFAKKSNQSSPPPSPHCNLTVWWICGRLRHPARNFHKQVVNLNLVTRSYQAIRKIHSVNLQNQSFQGRSNDFLSVKIHCLKSNLAFYLYNPIYLVLDIFCSNVWHQLIYCIQIDLHLVDREAYLTIDSNDDVIAFHSYSDNRQDCHHQCTRNEMMFFCNSWNYPDSHFSPSLFVTALRMTTTIVFIWPMMNSGTSSSICDIFWFSGWLSSWATNYSGTGRTHP